MINIEGEFSYNATWGKTDIRSQTNLDIAPAEQWGIRCGEGGHWINRTVVDPSTQRFDKNMFKCPAGHVRDTFDSKLAVLQDDVTLLEDPNAIFARKWYHASKQKDLKLDGSKLIHLGSREAALHVVLRNQYRSPHYLYEVTLNPQASVSEKRILEFSPGQTIEEVHGISVSESMEITRYVNVQEAPGSVSLVATTVSISDLELVQSFPQRP